MGQADSSSAKMTSAVYLTLRNDGATADTLLAAYTDVARDVEIHETRMEEGVMRMRQMQHVAIPAGESISMKPGGLHIMLIGLTRELAIGDAFDVTLEMAQSGKRSIEVVVRQPE